MRECDNQSQARFDGNEIWSKVVSSVT